MKYFFNCSREKARAPRAISKANSRQCWLTYVLDDHDEEGKLDGKGLLLVDGAGDVVGRDVRAHDLEDGGLDISVGQSLDVAVSHALVPDLKRLRSKEEDGKGKLCAVDMLPWVAPGCLTYPME